MLKQSYVKLSIRKGELTSHSDNGDRLGRGVIVNVASMLGLIGTSPSVPSPAYVASKHAVVGLTKADAIMYSKRGIRVNAICPGYVATPLLLSSTSAGGVMDREVEKTPINRLAKMEEIADAIVFLASPMSSYMCGAAMVVDGYVNCFCSCTMLTSNQGLYCRIILTYRDTDFMLKY